MPLNDMHVRCDKPEAKACTLGDVLGCHCLLNQMEVRAGGSAIVMPVNPK